MLGAREGRLQFQRPRLCALEEEGIGIFLHAYKIACDPTFCGCTIFPSQILSPPHIATSSMSSRQTFTRTHLQFYGAGCSTIYGPQPSTSFWDSDIGHTNPDHTTDTGSEAYFKGHKGAKDE